MFSGCCGDRVECFGGSVHGEGEGEVAEFIFEVEGGVWHFPGEFFDEGEGDVLSPPPCQYWIGWVIFSTSKTGFRR